MNLRAALIKRDALTPDQADEMIRKMKKRVRAGKNSEKILRNIGLEPDYVFDLL
jgi:hypothetical protein